MVDLATLLVGGAAGRPDSVSGFRPEFQRNLAAMVAAAPPDIQQQLRITSGYRSPEKQAELYAEALRKYGSPEAARKWVAPPGRSRHNHGDAADLSYLSPAAQKWAHANASQYGLAFPLSNENWHIEMAGARGGAHGPAAVASGPSPVQAQGVAGMFAPQGGQMPVDPGFGGIALMAMQQNRGEAERAAAEEEERARRTALLSGVGSMFV